MIPDRKAILEYEVRASWWARDVSWPPLQRLASRYFAWKVNRKYGRYLASLESEQRLKKIRELVSFLNPEE